MRDLPEMPEGVRSLVRGATLLGEQYVYFDGGKLVQSPIPKRGYLEDPEVILKEIEADREMEP